MNKDKVAATLTQSLIFFMILLAMLITGTPIYDVLIIYFLINIVIQSFIIFGCLIVIQYGDNY